MSLAVQKKAKVMYKPYSVLMSVYAKEDPHFLVSALDSMEQQTILPEEILVVEDGILPNDLNNVLEEAKAREPQLYTLVKRQKNEGLGKALRVGLRACRNDLIARMDSDDYSKPNRIEQEMLLMDMEHLDLVGTQVAEFMGDFGNIVSHSSLPLTDTEIRDFSKRRNPFRHPTILFKKNNAIEAGNYDGDFLFFEDWDLFNRMLMHGSRAGNVKDELVLMRVSSDFYNRRGGISYLKRMWTFKFSQLKNHYFSLWDFCCSAFPHVIVCLIPNKIRSTIYKTFLRRKAK